MSVRLSVLKDGDRSSVRFVFDSVFPCVPVKLPLCIDRNVPNAQIIENLPEAEIRHLVSFVFSHNFRPI